MNTLGTKMFFFCVTGQKEAQIFIIMGILQKCHARDSPYLTDDNQKTALNLLQNGP